VTEAADSAAAPLRGEGVPFVLETFTVVAHDPERVAQHARLSALGAHQAELPVEGDAALPVGRWVHVAVTKSALVARLWVDGGQVGENTNLGQYPARLGNTANNWVGRAQDPTVPSFTGLVDDLRIYQRGLTAAEIVDLARIR